MLASVQIDGVLYDSVGVRYKGFSSASTDRTKNPFNVKLDYVIEGQDHNGIDKLKLGNVIQDPSFVREILSYEIARKYMPASGANFAEVYINDVYWGLYANIEAVNKDFLNKHFGSRNNSFFKGNPEDLDLSGENSNLGNSYGTDSTDYYPYYDMKSDHGWTNLYNFIDVLNESPDSVANVLNVDRSLWMHAFNYTVINFDSYVGYAQNYYVYEDDHGRFNPILWDMNMSFASYRLTDASEHWSGFTIPQAQVMDPLLHHSSVSVQPRPLMRNLFENDTHRRMYLAHMRTIMEENFANQDYYVRAQGMQNIIDASVAADTNKFYSYTDFQDNINSTVSDLVDYPGITELMDSRTTFLSTYTGFTGAPDISNIAHGPATVSFGDDFTITAEVTDASYVMLAYRTASTELFTNVEMLDDGSQNDGAAGDGTYGFTIPAPGNAVEYYIYAENDSAGRFAPERAAYEFYKAEVQIAVGDLVINEFLASNSANNVDEDNDFDDWIELYNNTDFPISTSGLFLSDDADNKQKWALPSMVIEPGGYLTFWADDEDDEGMTHANFFVGSTGDSIFLSYDASNVIDSVIFGTQTTDVSTGRYPNGTGDFIAMPPTFGAQNDTLPTAVTYDFETQFEVFPNPAQAEVNIYVNYPKPYYLELRSIEGKLMLSRLMQPTEGVKTLYLAGVNEGLYFITISNDEMKQSKKLIVTK